MSGTYYPGTWREARKGLGVKGRGGVPWKLVAMRKAETPGRAMVTMRRYEGLDRVEVEVEVGYDDPIEILQADALQGYEGPPEEGGYWRVPHVASSGPFALDFLKGHLFMVHGTFVSEPPSGMSKEAKAKRAQLLADLSEHHETLHDLAGNHLGFPHLHVDEETP